VFCTQEKSDVIDVGYEFELVQALFLDTAGLQHARVADKYINTTDRLDDLGHHVLYRVFIGHVNCHAKGNRTTLLGIQFFSQVHCPINVHIGNKYDRPVLNQFARYRFTKSLRPSGHHADLVVDHRCSA